MQVLQEKQNGHIQQGVDYEMQSSILNKIKFVSIVGLLCLSGTSYAKERCNIISATETISVTEIKQYDSVTKSVIPNNDGTLQCSVMFNALINGQWYPAYGKADGHTNKNFVCNQALENAQQEVVRIAGAETIISNQHMVCDDNSDYTQKTGYEPEFTYKGFRCKYFMQTIEQAGKLYNVSQPACEIGPGQWISIENW
jgi:hypothetical protein|tara:strand:+ start:1544 stop:2137 length:594 start_codon:yes stop_codon:yes gene_type:complete